MKKRTWTGKTFLVLLISWLFLAGLPMHSYFSRGMPLTHDGENHLARFANYKIAIREGQWPPRWAPNLYHRYGYPVFNYNYPLANVLSLPFALIRLPYPITFTILAYLSLLGTLVSGFFLLKQWGFRHWTAWLASASILFAPYLVQNLLFRGNIGELMALPLWISCLGWVEWHRRRRWPRWTYRWSSSWRWLTKPSIWVGAGLLTGFWLSHNVSVLVGTPLLAAYISWRYWLAKRHWWPVVAATALALSFSLWFWLPALAEKSAVVVGGSQLARQYQQHFPTLTQLISAPVQFGYSYVGPVDSLSFQLGIVQLLSTLLASIWFTIMVWRRGTGHGGRALSWWLGVAGLLSIGQLAISTPLWEVTPFARYVQFPWRLSLFLPLTTAFLFAWIWQRGVRWQQLLLGSALLWQVGVTVGLQPVGTVTKGNQEYDLFTESTTTSNENLPVSFTYQDFRNWQPTAQLLSGEGQITVREWRGSRRYYQVTAQTPVTVVEPTSRFPGWQSSATQGNIITPLRYLDDPSIGGRIAYQLPAGSFEIKTEFTQWTWPRFIGNGLAVLSTAWISGWSAYWTWRQYRRQR